MVVNALYNNTVVIDADDERFLKKFFVVHYVLDVFYAILLLLSLTILGRGIFGAIKKRIYSRKGYTSINGNSSSYTVLPGTETRPSNHIPTAGSTTKGVWKKFFHVFLIFGCLTRIGSFVGFEVYVRNRPKVSSEYTQDVAVINDGNTGMECHTFFEHGTGNFWETTFDISTYFFFAAYCIVLCSMAEIYYHTKDSISQQRASVIRAIQNANRFETVKDEKVDKHITKIVTTICIIGIFVLYIISVGVVYFLKDIDDFSSDSDGTRHYHHNSTYGRIRQIPLYFLTLLYVIIGLLYCFFGLRIYKQTSKMLRSFSVEKNPGLLSKIRKFKRILTWVTVFSIGTFVFFILRAALMLAQGILTEDFSMCAWWVDLPYYLLLEVVPLFFVFVVFKYLPSRSKKQSSGELVAGY